MESSRTLELPDGVSIAYRITRASEARGTVVLLHGLASNLTRWSEFVERTALRERWNLLRVDLRGHGQSISRGRPSLERWCDDLAALLASEAIERAVPVGHSLGAQVALHFAARFPAHSRALVLIDPVLRKALRGRWRLIAALGPLLTLAATGVRALNALGLRRARLEPWDLRRLDEAARDALRDPASERKFIKQYSSARADLRQFRTALYLQELREMFRPAPALESLSLPVLALLSSGATFADAAVMARQLARLPDVRVERIECHHWPLTERPDEVRQAIECWLDSAVRE